MNAPARTALMDVAIEDVEYLRIDGQPLLARLYRPKGAGPFPAVVGVHGGAWTSGDRNNNQAIDQALAAVGVVVLALDFRLAPQAMYPASVADVNFGVCWLKAHAAQFASRPDWVGAVAGSSGAHQMLLSALRPRDARYASAATAEVAGIDADISFMVACWPIADPLARHRMAVARGNDRLFKAHHDYFGSEDAMREGNPQLILERGENVSLPSLLVLQGTKDDNVTPDMAEKFAAAYRARGGRVVLETFPDQPHAFVTREPSSAPSLKAIELMRSFVYRLGR